MSEEQLNTLSIFSLREVARHVGVSSPTSKKKQELIDEIVAIQEGRITPEKPKKLGRPHKNSIVNMGEIVNLMHDSTSSKSLSFKQNNSVDVEELSKNNKLVASSGIIQIVSGIAFLWVRNTGGFTKFFVKYDLIDKYSIKSGDFVQVLGFYKGTDFIIVDISSVENCTPEKVVQRKCFENISPVFPTETIKFLPNSEFANQSILYGENVFLYGNNNNKNTMYAINFLNECCADEKMYLNFSIVEKNKIYLSTLQKADLYVANLTDEIEYARNIVQLAHDRAMRLVEQGKNVVMVIDDVLTLASIDTPDLTLTKQVVALAKYTKNGSLTILTVMPEDKCINLIEKIADKKIRITQNGLMQN